MRRNSWKAVPSLAVICCGLASLSLAAQQSPQSASHVQTAMLELSSSANDGPTPGTAAPAASAPATTAASAATDPATTTAPPASVAVPTGRDAVIKELAEMKARIAQLEAALKARSGADDAADAEKDASALRTAEGDTTGSMAVGQTATAPPAAAAPTPPEITAETTTKEAPFPGDWTWLNSGGHNVDSPMATKYFTPEVRFDTNYIVSYNHPEDDTLGGSTEMFRSDEWQLEQVSVGGDFRIQNVRGRILTMDGLFATTTPRNDASPNRGQWNLANAYRYFSEAWGGYHWDVNHGLNVDAGIFVSYIGLFSYYNFDNWTYQPSFVSSNTPWFFNGLRIQWWPTKNLKIEPWIINGWQSYARYNGKPGLGGQILWRPKPYLDFVWNDYGLGEDDAGYPGRSRVHADYSAQVKFYDQPKNFMDKIAWTLTGDAGCEYGGGPSSGPYSPTGATPLMGTSSTYTGGVNCHNSQNGKPKQMFIGTMSYLRFWFDKDKYAMTLGGGLMNNPGRYLTLLPPINGATAISGTPYYTENAGDRAQMHDGTITFDYMPAQFITFRLEESYRYSDTPYWTGHGGITPPGGNNGNPADYQCAAGGDSGVGYLPTSLGATQGFTTGQAQAISSCIGLGQNNGYGGTKALWWPDLRTNQTATILAIMVRF
jgi:Putative beta-barrel porin-2, OmpL-like. bbp2